MTSFTLLLIGVLIGGFFLKLLVTSSKKRKSAHKKGFFQALIGIGNSYQSTKTLCTKSEQNFLNQLLDKLPLDKVYVSCKVRLADVALPKNKNNISLFNKVARKHIDFVICERRTSRILACIELDDSSHNTFSARKRDKEKNRALTESGVPLFRVATARNYTNNIQNITDILSIDNKKPSPDRSVKQEFSKSKLSKKIRNQCPRCPNKLETIDMKWPNKGYSFYSCTYCSFRTEPKKVE